MQRSKLVFSGAELQLACNQQVILTKNRIIARVYACFGELGTSLFQQMAGLQHSFPAETAVLPKISKGEQYRGFPWVMLDYPRWYNRQQGHLALRVMFLWGHYFLVQVQVSGQYLPGVYREARQYAQNGFFAGKEVLAGFPEDPWNFDVPQAGMENAGTFPWPDTVPGGAIFKLMEVVSLEGGMLNEIALQYATLMCSGLAPG